MNEDQKTATKLIIAVILLFAIMLYFSLNGCMAFKTMQINLTNDSSQIK